MKKRKKSGKSAKKNRPSEACLDPSRPLGERVADLLGRLTPDEKISLMMHESRAVDRLGIPEYNWWSECLHGVARAGLATVFPQAIGLAATFDPGLVKKIGEAIADEARAKYNIALGKGMRKQYFGLTFWTPNVNIFRDPRWGRGQETWGEDPFLTSTLGSALVRGLQGPDPDHLKTAACAKHFAVHSGPEKDRHVFNAKVSPKDLNETYLPAFKACVDAGVEAVMGAYNRTNDEPCCGSRTLLGETLRKKWGFEGHVVSDCGAIDDFHRHHKVTATPEESAAMAVKNGCDLNCGCTYNYLSEALKRKLLTEADLDLSVGRLLATRFKLGQFDPPGSSAFDKIGPKAVDSEKNRALARSAAVASIVLLKNSNGLLPIKPGIRSILVAGPGASSVDTLLANYNGVNGRMSTVLEGIVDRAGPGLDVRYHQGCFLKDESGKMDWSAEEAKSVDLVVAVLGLSSFMEGEEGDAILSDQNGDRFDIGIPKNQLDFLKALKRAGKPVVIVLTGGSPLAIPEVHELGDAILFAWYPGEEGGAAVADILFGDVSPSGRLPVTFPRSVDQLPAFEDYAMNGPKGRTYKYMKEDPLYPFGFGLSYSTVVYEGISLDKKRLAAGGSVEAVVKLANKGKTAVDEIVQLYLSFPDEPDSAVCSLKSFARVRLKPGKRADVRFKIGPETMAVTGNDGETRVRPGRVVVQAAGSAPLTRSVELGAAKPVSAIFNIEIR